MHAGWVLSYFALGSGLLAWLVFPHWRQAMLTRWRAWRQGGRLQGRRWGVQARQGQSLMAYGVAAQSPSAQPWRRQRWMWAAGAGALLLSPIALVVIWSLHKPRALEGFDDRIEPGNQQVAHLLRGEQLVPPAPLPPEVFTTAEVEVIRPMLASADRRWDQMDKEFVQRVLTIFKIMKVEHGYDMALLEGYRSPERQAMLAAKGSNVTMAGAWQSYHQYGLAVDCAFYRGGKLVISERDPWAMRGYQLYGQLAQQMGLTWGGHWQMMDLGHVEWRKPGAKAAIKAAGNR
jgi:peptidoglycan L-alanyl-D-glutamate endopeptidase CwlK